ncbi:hypothetical protein ANCCAN_04586 [Ancylostoma caninum]|uniref:Uncharacterized protein n=1 Tax=Ancylostoma caninum TaxID=29170 RepID=A0A368H232_ANCCA|nr:hypothetical protein ANCCAN_04586 [Ancylostoma caninum]
MWWMVTLISGTLAQTTEAPCDQILYMPDAGYQEKRVTIYYNDQFKDLAEDIECYLESLEIASSALIAVQPTTPTLRQLCGSSDIMNKTSKLHLTVTITEALHVEEMCQDNVLLLHMKAIGERWLAHIITPRSDVIIPLETEGGGAGGGTTPTWDSLRMAMEAVALLWGPVYFTPDKSRYKYLKFIIEALKVSSASHATLFLRKSCLHHIQKKIVIIPTLVVGMVFLVGVVGLISFYAKRKKQKAEQKTLRKRKALLLAEWGNESYQGAPIWNIESEQPTDTRVSNVSDGNQEVAVSLEDRRPKGSNEPSTLGSLHRKNHFMGRTLSVGKILCVHRHQ